MRTLSIIFCLVLAIACCPATSVRASETTVDFAREILPILSDKCFVCHGPDAASKSDLRLDSRDAATTDLGGYRAVDPTDLQASELLNRINSTDNPMPPEDSKPLTEAERELLRLWVLQGGQYDEHWAYVAPEKSVEHVRLSQAIDSMVGERLSQEGVDFAPEADREVLARRAALLLIGLPLEPATLERFLADERGDAYERLIDRLLADPRFGEHQARYWLDAVRYGDTHGLHLDNRRGIYPYRDWVVRALNQNLPLDEFITWQLAGDLLPEPTLDQLVATGFVRLNPSTGEGGAIPAEFQMKNNFDRVETFGTVFLGMSLTCARCHTHKYDPVEQSEYYRLMAFFNNTAEPAMDGNSYTYGPTARVPADQASWSSWDQVSSRIDELVAIGSTNFDSVASLQYARQRAGWSSQQWKINKPAKTPEIITAIGDDPSMTWSDIKGLPGAITGRSAADVRPKNGEVVWVQCDLTLPADQTLQLVFSGAAGSMAFVDRDPSPIAVKTDAKDSPFALKLTAGSHRLQIAMVGHDGFSELAVELEHPWDKLADRGSWDACTPLEKLGMLATPWPLFNPSSVNLANSKTQIPDTVATARRLQIELSELANSFTTSLIARELDRPRETRVLKRGEYDLPMGEPLSPDVLKALSPFPADAPRNRLGLARWLTSRDHPLVSRVLVNRIWQRVFGAGLVRTPEEFGLQGQQPTHPALLDWAAVELMDSGWDLKAMLRGMLTSRTFKQSSAWRNDLDDPENRLLARASSYRLDAEVLRDIGLWASELLDPHMGGEGVKPYQPPGMWAALAHPASNTKNYQRDRGQRLYRRSLYVYWKRTSPHPMMTLFDAPDRESSCVRRSRTNTPLQSLGLLNETQRVEMGRSLAARLIRESDKPSERVQHLFQLLAGRDPTTDELSICQKLVTNMLERYKASRDDASRIIAVGDAAGDARIDPAEHAAWTQLAMTILASDLAILMY